MKKKERERWSKKENEIKLEREKNKELDNRSIDKGGSDPTTCPYFEPSAKYHWLVQAS